MDNSLPPGLNSDRAFYAEHLMDLAVWEPVINQVFQLHGLRGTRVSPGIPGTFPTFMVELDPAINHLAYQSVVVKFFGPLFEGASCFHVEKELGRWLTLHPMPVHSPSVLADGQFDDDWSYLIFECISGVSFRQVRQSLSSQALREAADQLGLFLKALHTSSAVDIPRVKIPSADPGWSDFVAFLERQRSKCQANHQQWADLPTHLLPQLPDFLLPVEQMLDLTSQPYLIHADLTSDHILGRPVRDIKLPTPETGWDTLAIIDWGDARIGNILYELVALHLDLFQADKTLLKACFESYGLPDFYKHDFSRKALCMVLLHQFPMPIQVYAPYRDAQTLDELAVELFAGNY